MNAKWWLSLLFFLFVMHNYFHIFLFRLRQEDRTLKLIRKNTFGGNQKIENEEEKNWKNGREKKTDTENNKTSQKKENPTAKMKTSQKKENPTEKRKNPTEKKSPTEKNITSQKKEKTHRKQRKPHRLPHWIK